MKRALLTQQLYVTEPAKVLRVKNLRYRELVKSFLALQLASDRVTEDATSQVVFGEENIEASRPSMVAVVIAKQKGVVAGSDEVVWFLNEHTPLRAKQLVADGSVISKTPTPLIEISGKITELMAHERTILNMIGHLSGIATHTAALSKKVKGSAALLACTRKTRFGLLDKRACLLGGGGAHRLDLADAVLIKHNHLHAQSGDFLELLENSYRAATQRKSVRFFEVEVTTAPQALEVAAFFSSHKKLPCVLMLDNFSALSAKKCITQLRLLYPAATFLIECSGGISEKNLSAYSKTDAEVLSLGSLTYAASFLDVSMRMKN